jgi:hypothetical protein
VLRASAAMRIMMIGSIIILCAFAALFLAWLLMGDQRSSSLASYWPFTLVLIFWASIVPLQAWLNWRRNAHLRGEITYDFQPEGVRVITRAADAFLKWEAFIKSKETPNLFLLFLTKQMCHMVPKRAFASEADIEALRELLREKIVKR